MLEELSRQLKIRLSLPLPGKDAHFRMASTERRLNLSNYAIPQDARWSGVLIMLYQDEEDIRFPLIIRQSDGGVHSGQIGLPGGKFEPSDLELSRTALRETEEEIGIPAESIQLIGKLTSLYIPPSNFLVHPFIGVYKGKPLFIPDHNEVDSVLEFGLEDLLNDELIREKQITLSSGIMVQSPAIEFEGYTIWGATAMMMSELKAVLMEMGY